MGNNWETTGDCNGCRRQKYCSKPCKKHKQYERQIISEAFSKTKPGIAMNLALNLINEAKERGN